MHTHYWQYVTVIQPGKPSFGFYTLHYHTSSESDETAACVLMETKESATVFEYTY